MPTTKPTMSAAQAVRLLAASNPTPNDRRIAHQLLAAYLTDDTDRQAAALEQAVRHSSPGVTTALLSLSRVMVRALLPAGADAALLLDLATREFTEREHRKEARQRAWEGRPT